MRQRIEDEILELENFQLVPASVQADELQGRQSGSEEWRTQRGETGTNPQTCAIPVRPIVKPAPKPLPIHRKRLFNLEASKVSLAGGAQFSGPNLRIGNLITYSI